MSTVINRLRARPVRTIGYALFFIIAFVNFYPFFFSIISSLKSNTEIFKSFTALPKELKWSNYYNAINEGNILRYFLNTILLCFATVIICSITGAMASYILGRFVFRGRKLIYIFFIAGMMLPIQAVIIPMAYIFSRINAINSYPMLILMFSAFSLSMTILVLTAFVQAIPEEVEEAAMIDGATMPQIFFRIILPMTIPGMTSAAIFTFIQVWNNLLFPLVFISKKNLGTVSTGLLNYFGERSNDYGSALAAITLTIIPIIIIYILIQSKIEESMVAGTVKG